MPLLIIASQRGPRGRNRLRPAWITKTPRLLLVLGDRSLLKAAQFGHALCGIPGLP
jgi:hypothetical protein